MAWDRAQNFYSSIISSLSLEFIRNSNIDSASTVFTFEMSEILMNYRMEIDCFPWHKSDRR